MERVCYEFLQNKPRRSEFRDDDDQSEKEIKMSQFWEKVVLNSLLGAC